MASVGGGALGEGRANHSKQLIEFCRGSEDPPDVTALFTWPNQVYDCSGSSIIICHGVGATLASECLAPSHPSSSASPSDTATRPSWHQTTDIYLYRYHPTSVLHQPGSRCEISSTSVLHQAVPLVGLRDVFWRIEPIRVDVHHCITLSYTTYTESQKGCLFLHVGQNS